MKMTGAALYGWLALTIAQVTGLEIIRVNGVSRP